MVFSKENESPTRVEIEGFQVLFLSEEGMAEYWRKEYGDEFRKYLPDGDVQTAAGSSYWNLILINTSRIPKWMERYAIEHEKTEILVEREEIDVRNKKYKGLENVISEFDASPGHCVSIYHEYLLARKDNLLDQEHGFIEEELKRLVAEYGAEDDPRLATIKMDVGIRRAIKSLVEHEVGR